MSSAISTRQKLGFGMATALVVGNMIGSGVFLLPSALAPNGGISIVGWLVTAVGAMLLALVFARLARGYPKTGGPYAYSRLAFGDFIGFQTAWGYWINIWVGNAAIAVAVAGYLAVFWPEVGANPTLGAIVALAAIWLLTSVNALGVRVGGWVQAVTTVVKLIPLIAIGALVSTFGCLNGWVLLQGQVPLAAANDGVFPAIFGRVNDAGVPIAGLIVSSVLVTILVATNYAGGLVALFTFPILLATLATLIPYAYAAMAELMLFVTDRARFNIRNLTVDVIVALLAFAYALWAIAGAGADVVLKGTLLFLAGVSLPLATPAAAKGMI